MSLSSSGPPWGKASALEEPWLDDSDGGLSVRPRLSGPPPEAIHNLSKTHLKSPRPSESFPLSEPASSHLAEENVSLLAKEDVTSKQEHLTNMSWLTCEQVSLASVEEVMTALRVDPNRGLSTSEADRRRQTAGLNEIGVKEKEPLWKKYLEQFNQPFILLLLASAAISVLMQQFDDALSITFAIVIVVTVGFVQEYRSEKTLERMSALLPPSCHCMRDGELRSLFAKYLVPGDMVDLAVGDRIPADLRLVTVFDLAVDESSFTGETDPKYKTAAVVDRQVKMSVNDMANVAFQGTLVIGGSARGVVVCTGERSQFGEVFKLMQAQEPPRTPLQKSMDILGKQLSLYSLAVIGVIMTIGCIRGKTVHEMFNVGVSLAVAAIPEGLPIVVTVTLAFGVMRMARRNAVVKRLPTVEALGCVDYICSDKTGTLTTNQLKVTNLLTPSDIMTEEPLATRIEGKVATEAELVYALEVGIMCNDASISRSDGSITGAPIDAALLRAAVAKDLIAVRDLYRRVGEKPFSSETKIMVVECERDGVKTFFVKGAVETLLYLCTHIMSGGKLVAMGEGHRRRAEETSSYLGARLSRRALALARGPSMDQLEFVGLAAFQDPPRPRAAESVRTLHGSRVAVCMITGDSRETAASVAAAVAIPSEGRTLLSGDEVDKLGDKELEEIVEKIYCYYRTTPRHKVRIVKALQERGHIVGMTGDGVNDGVAIKKADVGICMGITGTDVCKEASDMILLDDDFSTILNAIEEGKCIFYNIRNFVRFQLSTSIAALMLISLSTLVNVPNPLNAMQILWINILMDGPPAQSLGLEPVDHEVLRRPPRRKNEHILSRTLLANILLSASIIIAGVLWVMKVTLEDNTMTERERTMTFTAFVFFDMFNALASRSQDRLIYEIGLFSNKYFCVAVSLSLLGQLAVIYLPPLQYIFQTESLSLEDLLLLAALSSSVFVVCEAKKFFQRYPRRSRMSLTKPAAHSV